MSTADFDIKSAFEQAMIDAGITPVFKPGEGIEFGHSKNGKPWRFHVDGDDKGTRNGWFVLFGDGTPAGEFGNWETGATYSWCSRDKGTLTKDEREEIKRRADESKAAREKAQKESEGEAAKLANLIWLNDARPITGDDHPYLKRKGVQAHGLRVAAWPVRNRAGEVFRKIEGTLIVPIHDKAGKIVSLQGIFPAEDPAFGRDKDFLIDGKKRGCFFVIGKPKIGGKICFVEGYATGATIHDATGWCVVVCWDAYNLPNVATVWRELFPSGDFVIAADNDQFTVRTPEKPKLVENPGVTFARQAAAAVGARVVVPEFADLDGKPTDFNDLAVREGIQAVQEQVLTYVAPPQPAPVAEGGPLAPVSVGYIQPRCTVDFDTYTPFPEVDGKGKPLPTARNLAELCRRVGATVRYDVIKKDLDVLIPELATSVDNVKEASYTELFNCLHRVRMAVGGFDGNLLSVADANQYNPVATWIESKAWDGVSRLADFFATVTAKHDTTLTNGRSLKDTLLRRWLISAVAAAYSRNGVVARGVLTFVSKQNLGKTYWAKRLAPEDLGVIADGLILNPSDKDSVISVVSRWIVELGEVDATFRKSDIAALKAFISRSMDPLRRPYARTESKYARRTIFFASVNDKQFLHDPTGNSRWWTIDVVSLDNKHTIDMQQVWAEVKSIYDSGESWHLNQEELEALNESNKDHESISPMHEMIDREYDWDTDKFWWKNPMLATDIAIGARCDKPNRKDVNEAAAYVVSKSEVETKVIGKARIKHWMMPPKVRAKYEELPL